jgi:iron complex outermembrane receptor protein
MICEPEPNALEESGEMEHAGLLRGAAALACLAVCVLRTQQACAQSDNVVSMSTPAQEQEVVITAERRAATVQSTPVSVTAISGAEIQFRGAGTLGSLVAEIPGVSQRTSGPGVTEFEMRGLASSGGSASTVGYYLDEVPLTAPAASQWGKVVVDADLYDVERLEVLRGPQGTLYGAGSMGGTIKVYTRPAKLGVFETSADVTGSGTTGGGFNGRVRGMVNLPISTDLAVRVVGTASRTSGWLDRVVIADFPAQISPDERGAVLASPVTARHTDINDSREESVRVSAKYTPLEDLTIVPSLLYQRLRTGGLSSYDSDPGTQAHFQPFDVPEGIQDRVRLASLGMTYRAAPFDTQLTLSEWRRDLRVTQDESEVNSVLLSGLGIIPPGAYVVPDGVGPGSIQEQDVGSQFSAELRLVSTTTGRLSWIAGAFFGKFDSRTSDSSVVPGSAAIFGTANEITYSQPQTVKQSAIFADVRYNLTDHLDFDVGARVFHYDDRLTTIESGWVTITGSDEVFSSTAGVREHGVSPKATLAWEPAADFTAFATVAKGFRPGAGNAPLPLSGPADCSPFLQQLGLDGAPTFYHSDSVVSYELGEKWRAPDRSVSVNASVFHIDWDKVQQTVPLACGYTFTGNEGRAKVNGADFEAEYALLTGLRITSSATYTDAELAEDVPATGGREGDRLQNAPRVTAAAALLDTVALRNGWQVSGRVGGAYVGNRVDATLGVNELPGYFQGDARVALVTQAWSVTLFVDNFTNRRVALNDVVALSANLPSYNRVATNQPRTLGLTFAIHN